MNKTVLGICARMNIAAYRAKQKLREKEGSFFTEHGLAIVIVVVIAAIIITAVVALFKDKIFPNLDNKIDDFFNIT